MPVKSHLRSAAATDPGKRRRNNEDRYYVDPERGIYAVIDGVGGHAAGETAAGVAVDVIRERLERDSGTPEERIRQAITLANNEILRLSRARAEWNGMACVLTVALIEDDIVNVGHVGDSRLYLIRGGEIQKITSDHSPVGEREDRGEISEIEAMRHARRNEIFRDVGSVERSPDDPGFIEMASFPMPPDGVLLLCSDGLTDLVSSAEVRAGVERYAPDFDAAARALIAAANDAGGKDNITIVIVAGSDFGEAPPPPRDVVTSRYVVFPRTARYLLLGLTIGLLTGLSMMLVWNRLTEAGPRTVAVGPEGINAAVGKAHDGDTVVIPEGRYREQVVLRQNIRIRAQVPGSVTITSPDGKPAIIADHMYAGGIDGVWIQGDPENPITVGIDINEASPTISGVKITGAGTGVEIHGASSPVISGSEITNNAHAGILVNTGAAPLIQNSIIAANGGGGDRSAMPGVEVEERARPVLKNNAIVDNAAEAILIHGDQLKPEEFEDNFFGGRGVRDAVRLISMRPAVEPQKNVTLKKPESKPESKPDSKKATERK
jgi:serine/threonine protein phosphatase PrpC